MAPYLNTAIELSLLLALRCPGASAPKSGLLTSRNALGVVNALRTGMPLEGYHDTAVQPFIDLQMRAASSGEETLAMQAGFDTDLRRRSSVE